VKKFANQVTHRMRVCFSVCCIAPALTLAMIGSGCSSQEKEKEPIVPVKVTTVRRAAIDQTVSAEAVVFPLQQAVVMAKITSPIKKFLVQRGSRVRKGQLLAVLENADLSAAAQQGQGELEQAQAGYSTTTGSSLPEQIQKAELDAAAAKAAFDAQQKVYDSRKELLRQGALPRRDVDSAEVALAQARTLSEVAQRQLADLKRSGAADIRKSASGQLTAARGKYLGATAQLSYSEIRSPIDGVVTDRPQYEGELATVNQPILTVMDTSKLIAKAHIAQSEAADLKVGNDAKIKVTGADEPIEGRVTLVSPALDTGSTTIEVWVESEKPSEALKPGMTAQLAITGRSAKDALVVPAGAVFKNDEGAEYVVLAGADNHAHITVVQTGIHNAEFVRVIGGLKEGDSVITSGGYALPDKTQIKVKASDAKEPDETSGGAAKSGSEKGKE
jgi:HlyD family secretion protein